MIAANTPQTGNGENAVNRENVIRGLEVCSPIGCAKEKCPYYEGPESDFWSNPDGYECEFNLRHDAIAMLKAQQPRVLALDEIHRDMVVWLEDIDKSEPVLAIGGASAGGAKCFITVNDTSVMARDAEYNTRWRAWTDRPTREQMMCTGYEPTQGEEKGEGQNV